MLAVFQELLKEGVSLHEPVPILRVLAESDETEADPLLSAVRVACHKRICKPYATGEGQVKAVRLSERLQAGLLSTLMARNGLLHLTLSIEADAQLRESVFGALNQNVEHGEVVVLCAPALRNALARWVQRYSRWQGVLSEAELADGFSFVIVQDNIDVADPSRWKHLQVIFQLRLSTVLKRQQKFSKDGWTMKND